jgi:hypothetical protein
VPKQDRAAAAEAAAAVQEMEEQIGRDGGCDEWATLALAGLSQSEAAALNTWSCSAYEANEWSM